MPRIAYELRITREAVYNHLYMLCRAGLLSPGTRVHSNSHGIKEPPQNPSVAKSPNAPMLT